MTFQNEWVSLHSPTAKIFVATFRKIVTPQFEKKHLMNRVAVSEMCEKHELSPNQFYTWRKQFFENGTEAFRPKTSGLATRLLQVKIDRLEKKLSKKDEVIAEIGAAYVKATKSVWRAVKGQ